MGWTDEVRIARFDDGEQVTLYPKRIDKGGMLTRETHELAGVTARVEDGAALEKRVTVTRLVAIGIFALAAQKKKGGESFLTIEGPDFFWAVEVGRKKKSDAVKFAAKVNDAAKRA